MSLALLFVGIVPIPVVGGSSCLRGGFSSPPLALLFDGGFPNPIDGGALAVVLGAYAFSTYPASLYDCLAVSFFSPNNPATPPAANKPGNAFWRFCCDEATNCGDGAV